MSTDVSLMSLHRILFEQIDRLNDPELTADQLNEEVKRADAMEGISAQIVNNARIMLKATTEMRQAPKEIRTLVAGRQETRDDKD